MNPYWALYSQKCIDSEAASDVCGMWKHHRASSSLQFDADIRKLNVTFEMC